MKIHPTLVPDVSIAASRNTICKGQQVIFTANATNQGLLPEFLWLKNGKIVGECSPHYADNDISNNDVIQCTLYSSEMCLTDYSQASNQLTLVVKPSGTLHANIVANKYDVCNGGLITFTASSNVSGTLADYRWEKSGEAVGNNAATFAYVPSSSFDRITCSISSDETCLINGKAVSNTITPIVHSLPNPSLDKNNALCAGGIRTLDAGSFRAFLWNNGSTAQKIPVSQMGKYFVRVTDGFGCSGSDTVIVDRILALPGRYLPGDASKCLYGLLELAPLKNYTKYQWSTTSVDRSIKVKNPGLYWLEVTDENNCIGRDSLQITLKQCKIGFYAPNAFTPNNDGKNDQFMPVLEGDILSYEFRIFNRWGQIVFASSDPDDGWKGTVSGDNADTNVYAWTCIYQLEDEPVQIKKGTVLLLR
ncbi:MAG TPA: gliding motility-associated C-terminal domain-containing protein [Flavitalea sp.]|nr:gliding motility-associated C-terminal domain-containing protein [Flavitalea sp.]